jgi:uncharacterized PurR-regulated membrane protein YhhQ (DUF165 family)
MNIKITAVAGYVATIPTANWMIQNVGTTCVPDGPCLIPVGFGLMAPSGVMMIGAALALRDMVHEVGGWRLALLAILAGAVVSLVISPGALVAASVAAYLLGELLDLAVYTPLRRRNLPLAVLASGAVGAVADSAAFLLIAFGSLDFIAGQVVGKMWIAVAAAAIVWGRRWWRKIA